MDRTDEPGLLPQGLRDLLPPDAAFEAAAVQQLMEAFAARGYDRIKPPLMEFEDAFLGIAGPDLALQTFRLMDPVSHRMLALRSDITPQVARIAGSRLRSAPRPLRLSYAGQVLQVAGSQLRPERQIGQAGIELIGEAGAAADAEVVVLAAEALTEIGVRDVAVDLNIPTLVAEAAAGLGLEPGTIKSLRLALDRKDEAAVRPIAGPAAPVFVGLLRAFGPAKAALERLSALALPPRAAERRAELETVVALIGKSAPHLAMTLDPVEHRGFEYQTGVSFIFYGGGSAGELGRGGRYQTPDGETATGFTLYTDGLIGAMHPAPVRRRIYLPHGSGLARAAQLRSQGWITVAALGEVRDPLAEARRLGCSHALVEGHPQPAG